jgi:hypothetical protein
MVHPGIRPRTPETRLMGRDIFRVKGLIFHPVDSWGHFALTMGNVTKSLFQLPTDTIEEVRRLEKSWVTPRFFVLNTVIKAHLDAQTSNDRTGCSQSALILLSSRLQAKGHLLYESARLR